MNQTLVRIRSELQWKATIVACLLLFGAAGCTDSQPKLGVVRGTVMLDGTPLTRGWVHSHPESGRGAIGKIQSDGTFELTTNEYGAGVVAGKHRLTVVALQEIPAGVDPDEADVKSLVPLKYAQPASSGLAVEVTPGENQQITLDLKK